MAQVLGPATNGQPKELASTPQVKEFAARVTAYKQDNLLWQCVHCSACKPLKRTCICAIVGPSIFSNE